jgi:hypothetical protein
MSQMICTLTKLIKNTKHLLYKINITRLIMKYIFILNLVGDINANTIHYKFS